LGHPRELVGEFAYELQDRFQPAVKRCRTVEIFDQAVDQSGRGAESLRTRDMRAIAEPAGIGAGDEGRDQPASKSTRAGRCRVRIVLAKKIYAKY
jgi:hypothetical protein